MTHIEPAKDAGWTLGWQDFQRVKTKTTTYESLCESAVTGGTYSKCFTHERENAAANG